MKKIESIASDLSCWIAAAVFAVGFIVLAVRLKAVQIDGAADYGYAASRQAVRRVQTDGIRGRIVDRRGVPLAENRISLSIVCDAGHFQKRTWEATSAAIREAIDVVAKTVGSPSPLTDAQIRRHIHTSLAMPLVAWRDIRHETLARFSEHSREFPGFSCVETQERVYPLGSFAAHIVGYVGRDVGEDDAGDEKFNFTCPEMRGRSGLEIYYDSFLRGVPGEKRLVVDARGFAISETTLVAPSEGPDLVLALDARIQRVVEAQLKGCRGACAVLDPRNGDVLALASTPAYNPNEFVPTLTRATYDRFAKDPLKPLLNRATAGTFAPGSTFKPVTALAGLDAGVSPDRKHECIGVFIMSGMYLHCARRWGHGDLDMPHAIMESCNPFFCSLGVEVGTNRLIRAAHALGLGAKTGIDLGAEAAGIVPDGEWKKRTYREPWYWGDLAQMSIGQGMLLVTPLQMARLAGAIGTGFLVTPHLKLDLPVVRAPLPFPKSHLDVVRRGMKYVVQGDGTDLGTGRRGGENVAVPVSGKTGTAEVGRGETRRKNTWFIAYAPSDAPRVAIAMIIENGDSGGGTTAPKVCAVLKSIFGERKKP